jgi:hypothetical protein
MTTGAAIEVDFASDYSRDVRYKATSGQSLMAPGDPRAA